MMEEDKKEILAHTIVSNTLVFEFCVLFFLLHMFQRLNYLMQAVSISLDHTSILYTLVGNFTAQLKEGLVMYNEKNNRKC